MSKLEINQLDLFSGIGGFHLGFERAGYKVNSYFSEIDKHAVAVYKQQFKDSTYVGSVTDVRGEDLPTIDLITFGSPCQDFSLAGKRKGMGGERSSLILEAIRLINECRPRAFVWENVKGTFSSNDGEDFAAILQAFTNIGGYRLEWQLLNTSWFLPQNRERIYLVGYSTTPGGDWRGVFPIGEASFNYNESPKKREAESIVYDNYNYKYRTDGKVGTLTAHSGNLHEGFKIKEIGDYRSDEGWRPRKDNNCPTLAARAREDGSGQPLLKVHRKGDGKEISNKIAPTLTGGGNSGGNHSDMAVLKVKSATSKGYEVATEGDSIYLAHPNSKTRRGRVGKGKAQTLDAGSNQAVVEPTTCRGGLQKNAAHFEEKSPALTSAMGMGGGHTPIVDQPNYRIRRLTPIECERLQGFPDNHTEYGNYDGEVKKMSNTQRYKQCGNAVTVDVVQAVAEQLKPIYYA